jgi:hypothetical protein
MGNTKNPIGSDDFFVAPRGIGTAQLVAAIDWRGTAIASPSQLIASLTGRHRPSRLPRHRAMPARSFAEVAARRPRRLA